MSYSVYAETLVKNILLREACENPGNPARIMRLERNLYNRGGGVSGLHRSTIKIN